MFPDMGLLGLGVGLFVVLLGPLVEGPPTLPYVLCHPSLLFAEGAGAGVCDRLGSTVPPHLVVHLSPGQALEAIWSLMNPP